MSTPGPIYRPNLPRDDRLDNRIKVLHRKNHVTEGMFFRIQSKQEIPATDWCRAFFEATEPPGPSPPDAEVWACQHPCVSGDGYVFEALLCRKDDWPQGRSARVLACRAFVATAGVVGIDGFTAVEVAEVSNPAWFAESIRHASRTAHVWSAASSTMDVREYCHDDWHGDGWAMLHGWLATVQEHVDVMHPRALSAHACAAQLFSALERVASPRTGRTLTVTSQGTSSPGNT